MFPRKQLDIGWSDLLLALIACAIDGDVGDKEAEIGTLLAASSLFPTFSVRTGFDLCLQALDLPKGSEVLVSALTIQEMADIAIHNGLIPIPLDIDSDTLSPKPRTIEAAISSRTRAILVAHLFGTRIPLDAIVQVVKKHGLFLMEDCAQAFTGLDYTAHAGSDVAMFSFGSIKTVTALGGALLRVKDPVLRERMRVIQHGYPPQDLGAYAASVVTHMLLKLLTIPSLYGLFHAMCKRFDADFEEVIQTVRADFYPEDLIGDIRHRASYPLLALLAHRLRHFDPTRITQRTQVGAQFAIDLPPGLSYPGNRAPMHSFWVFPVLVEGRDSIAGDLRREGFDATAAGSALSVIDPPVGRPDLEPVNTRDLHRKLLYLPVYPEVPARERRRLNGLLAEALDQPRCRQVTDARRIYSATPRTVYAPSTVEDCRCILQRARRENLRVCLMGVRHNLGGHAFSDEAIVLDLASFARIRSLDLERKRITVESGITWDKIQQAVNPVGLALKAMQSDNIFTVGGSLAANAHGRDLRFPTIADSVLGFRLMLADGSVISVSRHENADLFSLAVGGYGLFGVILDVDLELADDCVYQQTSTVLPIKALTGYFEDVIRPDSAAELFLARPSIAPGSFLSECIVTVWSRSRMLRERFSLLDHERNVIRDRFLFGLSRTYSWGKTLRWYFEKHVSLSAPRNRFVSRNNAMRPPVSAIKMFEHDSVADTDAIQEFFLPISKFPGFMEGARSILQETQTNPLGATVRYVKQNSETVLSYSPREDMFAVIVYFNELLSPEGRRGAQALITRLTQLAIEQGGTFYLTYVRDIAPDDLRRAYPGIDCFFREKLLADPECRFSSRFFEIFGRKSVVHPAEVRT